MHCWNGTWGVIAVGLFANKNLVFNAYGPNPRSAGPGAPDYFRHFGAWCAPCFGSLAVWQSNEAAFSSRHLILQALQPYLADRFSHSGAWSTALLCAFIIGLPMAAPACSRRVGDSVTSMPATLHTLACALLLLLSRQGVPPGHLPTGLRTHFAVGALGAWHAHCGFHVLLARREGGKGYLLAAQCVYALWIVGGLPFPSFSSLEQQRKYSILLNTVISPTALTRPPLPHAKRS